MNISRDNWNISQSGSQIWPPQTLARVTPAQPLPYMVVKATAQVHNILSYIVVPRRSVHTDPLVMDSWSLWLHELLPLRPNLTIQDEYHFIEADGNPFHLYHGREEVSESLLWQNAVSYLKLSRNVTGGSFPDYRAFHRTLRVEGWGTITVTPPTGQLSRLDPEFYAQVRVNYDLQVNDVPDQNLLVNFRELYGVTMNAKSIAIAAITGTLATHAIPLAKTTSGS